MKKLALLLLLFPATAFGQATRIDIPLLTSGPNVPSSGGPMPQAVFVANSTVLVCTHPSASLSACQGAPKTTYTDSTESVSCTAATPLVQLPGNTCTASVGTQANIGFWYGGGLADYWVITSYGNFGPYTVNQGSGSGGGTVGTATQGQVLINSFTSPGNVAGLNLLSGTSSDGLELASENAPSGINGFSVFGDSNTQCFGITGNACWTYYVAADVAGGSFNNYGQSGDAYNNAGMKAAIYLGTVGDSGDPFTVIDYGTNTARQGISTPAWITAAQQDMTAAVSWAAIPSSKKFIASNAAQWTASGTWTTQQSFLRSDTNLISGGDLYQVGDPLNISCTPSGTGISYLVSSIYNIPYLGTIGGTNTGYTTGTYNATPIVVAAATTPVAGTIGGTNSGYTNGVYLAQAISIGGNTTAQATVVVENGQVVVVYPTYAGTGYSVGGVWNISLGGGSNATWTVTGLYAGASTDTATVVVNGSGNVSSVTPNRTGAAIYLENTVWTISVGGGSNATWTINTVAGPVAASIFTGFGNNLCANIGGPITYATTTSSTYGSGATLQATYGYNQPYVSATSGNTLTSIQVNVPQSGVAYFYYSQWASSTGTGQVTATPLGGSTSAPLVDSITGSATLSAQFDVTNASNCFNFYGVQYQGTYPTGTCVVNTSPGTSTMVAARFTGLTPGTNTFTFTQTANGSFGVVGSAFPFGKTSGGVSAPQVWVTGVKPQGLGINASYDITYSQYVNEAVALQLKNDGLPVGFIPTYDGFGNPLIDVNAGFLSGNPATLTGCNANGSTVTFTVSPAILGNNYYPLWTGVPSTFTAGCSGFNGKSLTLTAAYPTSTNFTATSVAGNASLTACSANGTTATVTASAATGYVTGWTGSISGFSGACTSLNGGPYTITPTSGTTFTFSSAASIASSSDTGTFTIGTTPGGFITDAGTFTPTANQTYNSIQANSGNGTNLLHLSGGRAGAHGQYADMIENATKVTGLPSAPITVGGLNVAAAAGTIGAGINGNYNAVHPSTSYPPGFWPYCLLSNGDCEGMNYQPSSAAFGGATGSGFLHFVVPSIWQMDFCTYVASSGTLPSNPTTAESCSFIIGNGSAALTPSAVSNGMTNPVSNPLYFWQCQATNAAGSNCGQHGTIQETSTGTGNTAGMVLRLQVSGSLPTLTGDEWVYLQTHGGHGWLIDAGSPSSTFNATWNAPTANVTLSLPAISGTLATELKGTTATITGTALTATCDSGTVAITGSLVGQPVAVSSTTGADVGGAFNLRGSVTTNGTVTVYICGTGTPASLAYNVTVFP